MTERFYHAFCSIERANLGQDMGRVVPLTPTGGCRQPCSLLRANTASKKRSSAVRATRPLRGAREGCGSMSASGPPADRPFGRFGR